MTKKDYELLAEVFAIYSKAFKSNEENIQGYKVTGSALVREMVYKLADELQAKNTRFDKVKFAKACGVQ